MAEINDWNIVGSNNQSAAPDGWPENTMTSAQVNDTGREGMAVIARAWKDAVEGDGDSAGTSTAYTLATNRGITANYDGLRVGFHAHVACGSTVTLTVDSGATVGLLKRHDVELAAGDIEQHQYVEAVYSASDAKWQMLTPVATATTGLASVLEDTVPQLGGALDTNSFAVNFSEGTAVASGSGAPAGVPDIWATTGNTLHITGTTTITDFADAGAIGMSRWLIFDNVLTLTHGAAAIILPGSANITTAAGDVAYVYADAVDNFRVTYFPADGRSVVSTSNLNLIETATPSAAAEVAFDSTEITSTYDHYMIVLENIHSVSDGDSLIMTVDTGGVEKTGASDYEWGVAAIRSSSNTYQQTRDTADTVINLMEGGVGNAAGEACHGIIRVFSPMLTTGFTSVTSDLIGQNSAGSSQRHVGGGYYKTAEANNGVRISFSTGNIASGTIKLFGVT